MYFGVSISLHLLLNKKSMNVVLRSCPNCESEDVKLYGKAVDGRQMFKCKACGKKTTENKRSRGSKAFSLMELLPVHMKTHSALSNCELYSLGVLIADGSISRTSQMSITLNPTDRDVLEIIKSSLRIDNPINNVSCSYTYKEEKKTKTYCRLTWASRYSLRYWEYFGLFTGKTGKEVWMPYMSNPHFVRGFFDGDGGFSTSRNGIRAYFSNASLSFVGQLRLYINSHISNMGSLSFSRGCYNLQYFGNAALDLGALIYKDSDGIRSNRKYEKYYDYLIGNY